MVLWLIVAAFGGIFIVMAVTVWRRVRLMRRTPTIPCGDLATRALMPGDARLEITGIAEPGPAGPLRAPLSGEPCVWYGVRAVSRPKFFGGRGQRVTMRSTTTEAPFAVRDETGVARVAPSGVEMQSGSLRVNESEDGPAIGYGPAPGSFAARAATVLGPATESPDARFKYQEWIVAPGAPVYVLGSPTKDESTGELVLGSGSASGSGTGQFVIGAGNEADVVRSLHRKALGMLAIGLLFAVPGLTIAITGAIAILTG